VEEAGWLHACVDDPAAAKDRQATTSVQDEALFMSEPPTNIMI